MHRQKMEADSKALLLLWKKDIKESNNSLNRDRQNIRMTERERKREREWKKYARSMTG